MHPASKVTSRRTLTSATGPTTVTVLLNLLIAVMNASMSSVQANTIDAWKFVRTQVWLSYCNRQVSGSFHLSYKISLSQDSNPDQDPKL